MAISKRLRYEVLRRDNHACRYCGAAAPDTTLTVDHVVPTALGGTDSPENLVTACRDCNAGKSASSPDAPVISDVKADALRWARAMRRAAEMRAARLEEIDKYSETVKEIWLHYANQTGLAFHYDLPADWEVTAEQFFVNDVPLSEWDYAIRRAIGSRKVSPYKAWTYMCGIMWNRVREQIQVAEALANQPEVED